MIVIFDPCVDKDIDTDDGGEYKYKESESMPAFIL